MIDIQFDLELKQMDVKTSFLHGELVEKIYMYTCMCTYATREEYSPILKKYPIPHACVCGWPRLVEYDREEGKLV